MTRVLSLFLAVLTSAVVLGPTAAHAALFDWTFTGVVADVPEGFAMPRLGAPITLQARVDASVPNLCGGEGGGVYDAIGATRLRMDGLAFTRSHGSSLEVNAPDGGCGLPDAASGLSLRYLNGNGADGWQAESGGWPVAFLGQVVAGFAWNGSALPGALDRALADAHVYVFLQGRGDRPVVGRIDRVRIQSVPEPAAVLLLATVVLALGARRRTLSPALVRR